MTLRDPTRRRRGPDGADAVIVTMLTVVALLFMYGLWIATGSAPDLTPPPRPVCSRPAAGDDATHRACLNRQKAYDRSTDEAAVLFLFATS